MKLDPVKYFIYLTLVAIFNIVIAYRFGNNGYEIFVTTSIALGILITWLTFQLSRKIYRSHSWLIIKVIATFLLGFFCFITTFAVMLSVSQSAYKPGINVPGINWPVVFVGLVSYLIPRLRFYKIKTDTKNLVIGLTVSLYSIFALLIAAIGFYNDKTTYRNIILTVAVQLQFLMAYLITQTNYLTKSHDLAIGFARKLKIYDADTVQSLVFTVVALPFFVPLAVSMLILFL